MGLEPITPSWQNGVLPLNYNRRHPAAYFYTAFRFGYTHGVPEERVEGLEPSL